MKVEVDVVRPSTPSAADLRRRKILWFVMANVISFGACAGIFWLFLAVPEGTQFDGVMGSIWRFLRRHETVAVLAASLPFFASLLVGQVSAKKARAKRARLEAEQKRAELEAARLEQEAERARRRDRPSAAS